MTRRELELRTREQTVHDDCGCGCGCDAGAAAATDEKTPLALTCDCGCGCECCAEAMQQREAVPVEPVNDGPR